MITILSLYFVQKVRNVKKLRLEEEKKNWKKEKNFEPQKKLCKKNKKQLRTEEEKNWKKKSTPKKKFK